jgi:hypothetical protein
VAELEAEIRAVSAPLIGLIRTTNAEAAAQLGAAFIAGMLVMWVVR